MTVYVAAMAVHAKAVKIGRGGASRKPLRGGGGLANLPGTRRASAGRGRASFGRDPGFKRLR